MKGGVMDSDAIIEALDMIRDYAVENMLDGKKKDEGAPIEIEADISDEPEMHDDLEGDDEFTDEEEEEEDPKMTVMKRYDFAGAKLPKPDLKLSSKVPVRRR